MADIEKDNPNGWGTPEESLADIKRQEEELAARKAKLQEKQTSENKTIQQSDDANTQPEKFVKVDHSPETSTKNRPVKQSASILVLQWLTYAFWGWAILALAALLVNVLWYFIVDPTEGAIEFSPYGVAGVAVLLPISFITDLFYKKHDVQNKTGASSVIMIFHAVIFALFAIGALIASVFSLVLFITIPDSIKEIVVFIIAGLVMAIIYLLTFLRTLAPKKLRIVTKTYRILIGIFACLLLAFSVFGPLKYSVLSKNDRLIDDNLYVLKKEIDNYAYSQQKLPENLNELHFDSYEDSAETLVDSGLVEYKPNTNKPVSKPKSGVRLDLSIGELEKNLSIDESAPIIFYYQLCVTYKYEGLDDGVTGSYDYQSQQKDSDGNSTDINTSSHLSGDVCYKLRTGYDTVNHSNVYETN